MRGTGQHDITGFFERDLLPNFALLLNTFLIFRATAPLTQDLESIPSEACEIHGIQVCRKTVIDPMMRAVLAMKHLSGNKYDSQRDNETLTETLEGTETAKRKMCIYIHWLFVICVCPLTRARVIGKMIRQNQLIISP